MATSPGLLGRIISKAGIFKSPQPEERRRARRFRIDLPIRFRIVVTSASERSSPFLCGQLYDLSELGVGIFADCIEHDGLFMMEASGGTGEPTYVEIEIPWSDDPLRLNGKAVWYLRNPEGHRYSFRIGIQFVGVTPEHRKALQRLIQLYHSGMGVS